MHFKSIFYQFKRVRLKVKIVSNVTAVSENEPSKIKQLLVKQIYSKVRLRESVNFMANNNTKEFVEIGPGKVLSGLIKRTNDKVMTKSINSLEDIEDVQNVYTNLKFTD